MKQAEMLLKKEEQVIFSLRALFEQYGYKKFKMSKFEEYDFYADNRSFLSSENILTFTGLDGKLLALKPDVTLSIVKNTKGSRENAERVYYNENVYRARKSAGEYKEIMQVGLEYIGEVDDYATLEVLLLAQKSLKAISDQYIMDISHMGFVAGLMEEANLPYAQQKAVLSCISEKNPHGVRAICMEAGLADEMEKARKAKKGLWADEAPVKPYLFRKGGKQQPKAPAELPEGIVFCHHVQDGDTFKLADNKTRVRLWGIDAPEKGQPYADEARDRLKELCEKKAVRLEIKDTDQYGRKTAIVWLGSTNINLQLVKEGLAWHYAYFAPDAKDLAAAEKAARKARKGLWKDKNPVNPYEFRKNSK